MSDYLQKIVYLSQNDYETLASGTESSPQSVTKNGVTLTNLNNNYIYVTDGKVTLSDFDANFVLPVSKGGTGASSWASGKILVGNGSSTFSTIDKATAATGGTLVERNANGDFSARNITMTQGNIGSMTLSGTTIAALTAINTSGGNGLLAYKPSSWTGVSSSQWGVGTIDVQGVIRSSNTDLLHSRNGTNSVILDANNYTSYTVTKTGSGASGSWGIDISGTATTATNLSAAPTITQAGSSGTTLSAATFYTLTVGGQTVVFKTPTDTKNSAYGNINTSGQIGQTTNWALANGDALVVADSDNSWKLERTGITFDASTETECLTKKGTWKAFNNYSLPTAKNDTLGGVKPWYSHTAASTGPTTGSNATAIAVNAIQTTAGRYYAVESDSNGRLFVNVPWTNVNNSYLTSHNNLVTQNVKTDNKKYGIILSNYETSASTTTAAAVNRDSKVYVNPSLNSVNAGQFVLHDKATTPVERAYMIWNATDQSIDFVFN